ncbi:hypothetical protein OBV_17840 [Oscillibacter valericigenes Sjm18-20]|nr:hypothetical protein OBV_17840 [Oscillibacter valericigenes Sjm18-20]
MKVKKNGWKKILACGIILISLLSVSAEAADQTKTASRQGDLDYLYSTLKTSHPNLFANTPESAFEARKSEIERQLDTESNFNFALDCASLAALAKDSHTNVSLGSSGYSLHVCLFDMDLYDGTWVLSAIDRAHQSLLGSEVTAINGFTMEQVLEKFETFLSADNPVKLQYLYWQMCYVLEPYEYLGVAEQGQPLRVTVKDPAGNTQALSVSAVEESAFQSDDLALLKNQQASIAATAYDKAKVYFGEELNDHTYYIQYNQCAEDPSLPMKTFCQEVQSDLDAGNYSLILIDLRNNGGGSDGVLAPMLELLAQQRSKGIQVAGLIGRKTFSSAIINAVELQEMGFPLAGEDTGGSVDHFGSVQSFQLPSSGLRVGISSKFISLSNYFDAASGKGVETLQPDVKIAQTLRDTLTGRDTCVEAILSEPGILKPADRSNAPMTRGRFVSMLYKAAGSPAQNMQALPFDDLFGIEWYLPAVNWAKSKQIALGDTTGKFISARAISWQEAAVFMVRSADALDIHPAATQSGSVPAILKTAAWSQDAVQKARAWGLLPESGDFSTAPTRVQGETMIKQLLALRV